MKITFFDSLPSTQEYLVAQIRRGAVNSECCIVAETQSKGIGSRGNKWKGVERGLYFSFALHLDSLPKDLQTQSMAIFFAFNFMQTLRECGSQIWLKYPNDLFLGKNKIGGVMCGVVGDFAVCGIGLNVVADKFAHLEPQIGESLGANRKEYDFDLVQKFLQGYFARLKHCSWGAVFSAYSAEFHKNYDFSFHANGEILSLKNATLCNDGAIKVGDKIIYCAR